MKILVKGINGNNEPDLEGPECVVDIDSKYGLEDFVNQSIREIQSKEKDVKSFTQLVFTLQPVESFLFELDDTISEVETRKNNNYSIPLTVSFKQDFKEENFEKTI